VFYYYDDCGSQGDHWAECRLDTGEQALSWFRERAIRFRVTPCILYDENYRTIRECKSLEELQAFEEG
jgi:hypothetical protein